MVSNSLGEIQVLLGCAAPTGMGAVKNVLRPNEGESIVIFGAGGVGLCALLMARHMKLSPPHRCRYFRGEVKAGKKFGADIAVNVAQKPLKNVMQENGLQNVDHLVEVSKGNIKVFNNIMGYIRPQGGRAVIVGNAPVGQIDENFPVPIQYGKIHFRTLGWG